MKVLFVDDVPNVARVGQTKDVANGYARNFLFPRKLAVLADSAAAAAVDAHLKKLVKQRAVEESQMAELAKKIGGLQITLRAKVGDNDKLYGSITGADIAEALSKSAGCLVDKKNIALAEPIKTAGLCDVTVKFMREIQAIIKVNVIDENAVDETPVKPAAAEKQAGAAEEPAEAVKEKAEKKEKKAKAEKLPKEEKAEAPTAAEEKAPKPAKEKKAKAEKPAKEAAPEAEEKKEKKPKAKAKKEDKAAE